MLSRSYSAPNGRGSGGAQYRHRVLALAALACLTAVSGTQADVLAIPNRFRASYESVFCTTVFSDSSNVLFLPIKNPSAGLAEADMTADTALARAGLATGSSRHGSGVDSMASLDSSASERALLAEGREAQAESLSRAGQNNATDGVDQADAASGARMRTDSARAVATTDGAQVGQQSDTAGIVQKYAADETHQQTLSDTGKASAGSAPAEQTVVVAGARPKLCLEKSANRDTVWIGRDLTYYLSVRNAGPLPVEDVVVVDTLVEGYKLEGTNGGMTAEQPQGGQTVLSYKHRHTLRPGESFDLSYDVVLTNGRGAVTVTDSLVNER